MAEADLSRCVARILVNHEMSRRRSEISEATVRPSQLCADSSGKRTLVHPPACEGKPVHIDIAKIQRTAFSRTRTWTASFSGHEVRDHAETMSIEPQCLRRIRVDFDRSALCPARGVLGNAGCPHLPVGRYPRLAARSTSYSRMTFFESSSCSIFLFEHDLRANAFRVC